MMGVKCFLRCLLSTHPDIPLPHGMEVVIGRGKITKIKEARCSRKQLTLIADCKAFSVNCTQVGINNSSLRGEVIGSGKTVIARHKDILDVLSGELQHQFFFSPSPTEENNTQNKQSCDNLSLLPSKKRKPENESELNADNKKLKVEVMHNPSIMSWFDCSEGKNLSEKNGVEWLEIAGGKVLLRREKEDTGSEKIAAFDIDGTLITTKSGRVFPTDIDDWKILYSEVPGKLKDLVENGYKLVLITNQAGIAKGKLTVEQFQMKMSKVLTRLGVPCMVFASISDIGYYRKPRPGIWEWMELKGNRGICVDRNKSFYCGDAAGRHAGYITGKKKDFSCSDRLLASNLDIPFYTPEELFLRHKPTKQFAVPFSPKGLPARDLYEPANFVMDFRKQSINLLVGIQGSGKSHIARSMEEDEVVVASNDRTGSKDKTLKVAEKALSEGRNVVVDNTHVDQEARKPFIALGRKYGVHTRCFVMTTSHDHARHNNLYREIIDTTHTRIKEPLFNQYRARYVPPALEEGFDEIVKVNCVPRFKNKEEERLYNMHLLEK